MTTYTREDLRDAVLGELGAIDPNEPPSPEDAKLANDRCQQVLEMMYEEGLVWWDIDGDLPARAFLPTAQYVARELIVPYGAFQRATFITTNAERAEDKLWELKGQANVGLTQTTDYF